LTLNNPKVATDTAIITVEGEYETVAKLSNGTSFYDTESPLRGGAPIGAGGS